MVSVCLEHFADVFAFERCPELIRFVKLVPMLWWCVQLIVLVPVAAAAQARGVVGREHCPTARTATATAGTTSPWTTGSVHPDPCQALEADLAPEQGTWVVGLTTSEAVEIGGAS